MNELNDRRRGAKKGFISAQPAKTSASSPDESKNQDLEDGSVSDQIGWEAELARAEKQVKDQTYDYFFMGGKKERKDGLFAHPREIVNEIIFAE